MLGSQAQRLATGDHRDQLRTGTQQIVDETGRVHDLLEIVEKEQAGLG